MSGHKVQYVSVCGGEMFWDREDRGGSRLGSCAALDHVCACVYVGEQCYGIWLTLADYGCFVLAE